MTIYICLRCGDHWREGEGDCECNTLCESCGEAILEMEGVEEQ